MMKHIKESTNVAKRNKQLAISFILAGAVLVTLVLIRIFSRTPLITGVIPNVIAMVVLVLGII